MSGNNTIQITIKKNNIIIGQAYISATFTDVTGYNLFEYKDYAWLYWNTKTTDYSYIKENILLGRKIVDNFITELLPLFFLEEKRCQKLIFFPNLLRFLNKKPTKINVIDLVYFDLTKYINLSPNLESIEAELNQILKHLKDYKIAISEQLFNNLMASIAIIYENITGNYDARLIITKSISKIIKYEIKDIIEVKKIEYIKLNNKDIIELFQVLVDNYGYVIKTRDDHRQLINLLSPFIDLFNNNILIEKYMIND